MKNQIHDVLKKYRNQADYLDVRAEDTRKLRFGFSNEEMTRLSVSEDQGYSIRACIRGGWGFASLNSPELLDEYAGLAIEQARSLAGEKTMLASVKSVVDTVNLEFLEDPRLVPMEEKMDLFRGFISKARGYSDKINNVSAMYFEEFRTIHFMTSEGTNLTLEKLDLGGGVTPQANKNDITQFQMVTTGSSNDFSCIRKMGSKLENACRWTVELLDAPLAKAGRYTVILDPILGGTFVHEAFGHMSEADEYQNNPQLQKIFTLGRRFGSDGLSIYDTGLDIGSRGYLKYDDEGVPGEKTWLIRDGILVGRLHSRESAARLGEKPTGNARCLNYRFPPICRMRNTCIAPGGASFEELISGIDLGVYAVDTHGGTGGEMFSFDAAYGFMIRNGKLAEPVRDVQLSGNLFKTLKNIEGIGNDFSICDDSGGCGKGLQMPLETTCSSPHLRIKNITVGGS
ncbi:TldD/PmbA family protein [bacterium]|nr:TldD/PmbA family protein [bacterium]